MARVVDGESRRVLFLNTENLPIPFLIMILNQLGANNIRAMKNPEYIENKMRELAQIKIIATSDLKFRWYNSSVDFKLCWAKFPKRCNMGEFFTFSNLLGSIVFFLCIFGLYFETCWVLLYLPFWFVWDFPFAGKARCEWQESIAKRAKTTLCFLASFDIFTFQYFQGS